MLALPVFPDWGLEVALPPLPVEALLVGALVADPEAPVLPDLAVELLVESPELAEPLELGLEVAVPELPVFPELPEVALPLEVAPPELDEPLPPLLLDD